MNRSAKKIQPDFSKITPKPLLDPTEIAEWLKAYIDNHSEKEREPLEKPEVADLVICLVERLRPGNGIQRLYEKFKSALC